MHDDGVYRRSSSCELAVGVGLAVLLDAASTRRPTALRTRARTPTRCGASKPPRKADVLARSRSANS
ncbi:hypothetical protein C9J85_06175 [Haloferax sp. wsp5]|nr:hypothetical protein C9J85_06175 [Haloferax sp. wsp5]